MSSSYRRAWGQPGLDGTGSGGGGGQGGAGGSGVVIVRFRSRPSGTVIFVR